MASSFQIWLFCCLKRLDNKAFHDRPVGRRPGLNGSAFSRRLFGRGCKCHTSNHLQPRLFSWLFSHGCRPTGSRSPFQKYSKCQGRGQGGVQFFYSISWGFNSIWVDFFPRIFAYQRTLLGVLLSKIYKYGDWRLLTSRSASQSKSILVKTAATEIVPFAVISGRGQTVVDWMLNHLAPTVDPPAGCEKPWPHPFYSRIRVSRIHAFERLSTRASCTYSNKFGWWN